MGVQNERIETSEIMLEKLCFVLLGGSRGIGLTMALKAARDGAKIVIAAKTADPHPKEQIFTFHSGGFTYHAQLEHLEFIIIQSTP